MLYSKLPDKCKDCIYRQCSAVYMSGDNYNVCKKRQKFREDCDQGETEEEYLKRIESEE